MSFRICRDGGMILLTPTIEKMIFLSSGCAIFVCFCFLFFCAGTDVACLLVCRPYGAWVVVGRGCAALHRLLNILRPYGALCHCEERSNPEKISDARFFR